MPSRDVIALHVLVSIVLVVALAGAARAGAADGAVCFLREENGGSMNLLPVRLFGGRGRHMKQVAELRGGQKACIRVAAGRWRVQARSNRPYEPTASDPNGCTSNVFSVDVREAGAVTVTVSPKADRATYVCGWDLASR